jgi:hypothetical protein
MSRWLAPRGELTASQRLIHDVESNVSVKRVTKRLRHRGKDLKAERAPQPDRRRIGFDNRIELHRPVAVCACLFKDMPAQSSACALTTPRRLDDKAGIGNMCPRARVNGISVRAADDASAIIHGDNGAAWRLSHPPGACSRFGSRGIPGQGLACGPHLAQDRPDSGPVLCRCLTYHHVGKHGAARTHLPPTGRAPSWELGSDRRRLCLGVGEEVAAVALGRKTAGQ